MKYYILEKDKFVCVICLKKLFLRGIWITSWIGSVSISITSWGSEFSHDEI